MELHQVAEQVLSAVEDRRRIVSGQLVGEERANLGQFFTPSSVARFIASLPSLPESGTVRILDPGAGMGSLTAALVARIALERPALHVSVTAVEIDQEVSVELRTTLERCHHLAKLAGCHMTSRVLESDFLDWASGHVDGTLPLLEKERFDIVIMNPPYRKVRTNSRERRILQSFGVDMTNLYVAFLTMGAALLDSSGQIVAITPRSFANGPYFRSFRRYFFERVALERIHVFESRAKAFAEDAVLQENIIFCASRTPELDLTDCRTVRISVGDEPDTEQSYRSAPYREVIDPSDPDLFLHILAGEADCLVSRQMAEVSGQLPELGIEVSTGRVVDFRLRSWLRSSPEFGAVPLIYPAHLRRGSVDWPGGSSRKAVAIVDCPETASVLMPAEIFVLVKRFTSKEERRRVVATVFEPADVPSAKVGFENHLNVYHHRGRGLDPLLARGLAAWLNSTLVDRHVRSFSGHTQINATDLRRLPYPSISELSTLGEAMGSAHEPDQSKTDALVAQHVRALQGTA